MKCSGLALSIIVSIHFGLGFLNRFHKSSQAIIGSTFEGWMDSELVLTFQTGGRNARVWSSRPKLKPSKHSSPATASTVWNNLPWLGSAQWESRRKAFIMCLKSLERRKAAMKAGICFAIAFWKRRAHKLYQKSFTRNKHYGFLSFYSRSTRLSCWFFPERTQKKV